MKKADLAVSSLLSTLMSACVQDPFHHWTGATGQPDRTLRCGQRSTDHTGTHT